MNKVVFKAPFSNHGLLDKPGDGEVQREGTKSATKPIQVKKKKCT